jgi:hypothetical protein
LQFVFSHRKAAHSERSKEHMERLHSDPDFRAANAERAGEQMKRMLAGSSLSSQSTSRSRREARDAANGGTMAPPEWNTAILLALVIVLAIVLTGGPYLWRGAVLLAGLL